VPEHRPAGKLGVLLGLPGRGTGAALYGARAAARSRNQGEGRQMKEVVLIQDDIITRFFR
jgi:hypothetical protein